MHSNIIYPIFPAIINVYEPTVPADAAVNCIVRIRQKLEEGFDASFKPTRNMPRYYVITELKDGRWYREAWFLPEKNGNVWVV